MITFQILLLLYLLMSDYAPTAKITSIVMAADGHVKKLECKITGATNGQIVILQGTTELESGVWFDLYSFKYQGATNYNVCADLNTCEQPPDEKAFYRLRLPLNDN